MRSRLQSNGFKAAAVFAAAALIVAIAACAASAATTYTVRTGDSLFLIARRFGVTVDALRAANGLSHDWIYPGARLTIPTSGGTPGPSGSTYTVRSGDSLFLIANRYGVTVSALRSANGLSSDWIYTGEVLRIPAGGDSRPADPPSRGGYGSWNASDLSLLARLVTAESSGEPYEGQVAVAATVLNRVRSGAYPDTIPGVVYQVVDGKYYQFSPVLDGRINTAPSSTALRAVQDAVSGWDPSYGALGFYNPAKTSNYWVKIRPVTRMIGGHVFFK